MNLQEKILGGFRGAAVGDAMGAPTEMMTTQQIKDHFGGLVRDFKTPPENTFARGRQPGQITDDFSLAYYLALAIIDNGGKINDEVAKEGLLKWADNDEYFIPFAGPTTRASILELQGINTEKNTDEIENHNAKATNGSAMKIFPVGLLNPGDLDKTVEDTVTVVLPTHGNHLSISGACAVACAVSKAMEKDSNIYSIVQAGLYGARLGEKKGMEKARIVAGPSVERRIEMAVELGLKAKNMEDAMRDISDCIGSSIHISEAVPAAFGLFVAAQGDTMESIVAGVNVGNDTDTVATMAGAMAGTLNGYKSLPESFLEEINKKNNMCLDKLSRDFLGVISK